jgi:hypothetical protein
MPDDAGTSPQDYGLVEPISLPADSRIPGAATGRSTPSEYDGYFRITRKALDLGEWSATCLQVQEKMLRDLEEGDLSPEEREYIVRGFLTLNTAILRHWISAPRQPVEAGT